MKTASDLMKYLALAAALTAGAAFMPAPVRAQATSPLVITWEAGDYFPADFPGKALVTTGAPVSAAVALIQGSKLTDLSQAQISWFVNDVLVQSGTGLDEINFTAAPDPSGLVTIRVQVQTPSGGQFQNSASIVAAAPFAVIDYPSITKAVPEGGSVTLTAWPYFFNVSAAAQLSFTWQVNGQTIQSSGNQLTLQLGAPQSASQAMLPVTLTVQNSQNPLEFSRTVSVFNITDQ